MSVATRKASEREEKARRDVMGDDAVWKERSKPTDRRNGRAKWGDEREREGGDAATVVAEQKRVVEEETVAGIQGVMGSGDDREFWRCRGRLDDVQSHHTLLSVHAKEARGGVPGDGDRNTGKREGHHRGVKLPDVVERQRFVATAHAQQST